MLVVTGGIACGKSVAAEIFLAAGLKVLDADDWFHKRYKDSEEYKSTTQAFGGKLLTECAFSHPKWGEFELTLLKFFCKFVDDNYNVLIIPEYFKYQSDYTAHLPYHKVLTIERTGNLEFAKLRDYHRDAELTQRIFNNQTSSETRIKLSDYVIYNSGSIEYLGMEVEKWLKSHLQEVLTLRT